MSIKNLIQDGEGTKVTAGVTSDHALKVAIIDSSAKDIIQSNPDILTRQKILVASFMDNTSSVNLNVDGSVSYRDFYIESEINTLKSLHTIRFVLNDTQLALSGSEGTRFGSGHPSGLANGIRFFAEQGGDEIDIFVEPVQILADFLNYSSEFINEAGSLGAGLDLVVVQFDLPRLVNVVPGVIDKLVVRVQDDLTSLDKFRVFGMGYQEEVV